LLIYTTGITFTKKEFVVNKLLKIIALLIVISFLFACIPGDGKASTDDPAGFFSGIWHGWLAPVSLVFGIFNNNIRVYESANTGWWYDLGFYMAIISGFGGISLSRNKFNKKRKDRS
jgi:hypothetical protein